MGALLAWAIHWHWKGGLVARGRPVAGGPPAARGGRPGQLRQRLPGAHRWPDRRLHVRVAAADGAGAGRRRARGRGGGGADPAGPRRARRRAAGADDGAASGRGLRRASGPSSAGWQASRSAALRSLIRQQDTVPARSGGRVDLAGALEAMATAHPVRVEVATPGGAVLVDEHVGDGDRRCRQGVPRQRAGPRRTGRRRVGAGARPHPTRSRSPCATTVPASPRAGSTRQRPRGDSASPHRSAAASRASAAPPPSRAASGAPSGS